MREQDSSPSVAFHPSAGRRTLLFGPFRFDLADKTLSREGEEIRLPPRALAILSYLIERPQRVVSKEELMDAVWKDAFVGESSLTEAIGVLRQALGDSAAEGGYIQTIHRRGYRFVATLQAVARPAPSIGPSLQPTPSAHTRVAPVVPERVRFSRHPRAMALSLIGVLCAGAWLLLARDATPLVTRATITLPAEQAPAPALVSRPVAALSPDGSRIVYVAGAPGSYRLFLRAIDQFEAIPLPGTDGAHAPFFSPDGDAIGFFAGNRLFVMKLPDGQPIDVAEASHGDGGWWHTDGTIIFATGAGAGLYRIPSTGGERRPIPLDNVDGATLRNPSLLADGRTVLATAWKMNVRHSEIVAIDAESGTTRTIARGVHPRALPDGRVLYVRDGDLVASPMDGGGPEVTLISGIMTGLTGSGQYSLAANGTLLYVPEVPARLLRRIVRISEDGQEETLLFEPRPFQNLALSPDGRHVLATVYERGASDLWLGDIERGVFQRVTSAGGTVDPVWAHDGRSFYFSWARSSGVHVYRMPIDGSSPPVIVSSAGPIAPMSVTSGGLLFALRLARGGEADILTIDPDGTPRPWLATSATEMAARVSPDGRFLAYQSNKSGRFEVYVRPVSGRAPELQVSTSGGIQPGWSADGRTILFASARRLFGARFDEGRLSRAEEIYANTSMVLGRPSPAGTLALVSTEEEKPLTTLNLVVGWLREVRERR